MNNDQDKSDTPSSVIIDIDQQTKSNQQLEDEIRSIPLTDYSDYNIDIEPKTEFNDALFSNEDELDEALEQRHDKKTKHSNFIGSSSKETDKPKPVVTIDFTRFYTSETVNTENTDSHKKLQIINNSLNCSPAKKLRPKTVAAEKFDRLYQELNTKIENEQAAVNEPQEESHNDPIQENDNGKISALTNIIKKQSLALSKKSKQKFEESKAEIDEYLGRTLADRTVTLDFLLPLITKNQNLDELLTPEKITKFFSIKGKSVLSQLQKCDQQLSLITKLTLSNKRKLELIVAWRPIMSERINSLIAMYERKPVAYDDPKRSQMISLATSIMKLLITGYKQIYSHWYESSNLVYGTHRQTVNQTAFQLIDCLYMDLRLSIALHCPPTTAAIKTFNKLYYVLSLYEPQLLKEKHYSYTISEESSVDTVFVRYQLELFFQTDTLSSTLHKAMFSYLENKYPLTTLLPFTISQRLPEIEFGQQSLIVNQNSDQQSRLTDRVDATTNQEAIYIKVQNLFNAIKKDYVDALKSKMTGQDNYNPAEFSTINSDQSLIVLAMLNQSIVNAENKHTISNYTFFKPQSIKAYCGLNYCKSYLEYYYNTKNVDTPESDNPNKEIPAPAGASKGVWSTAGEDDHLVHLQITESKLGIAIDIGQLLLLIVSDDSKESPSSDDQAPEESTLRHKTLLLTQIIRLQRDHQGKLNVTGQKLSNDMVNVSIIDSESKSDTKDYSGIMSISNTDRLLITTNDIRYPSNKKLKLIFPDQSESIATIAGLTLLNNDAQVLTLSP
jgi:hypothetical protein